MWTADTTVITADNTGATADGFVPGGEVIPPSPGIVTGGYTGGASRGRMIRRRRRDEVDLEPPPLVAPPPDLKPPPLSPPRPPLLPPQPSLMAGVPMITAQLPPTLPLDEDEEEIALLLELLS